MVERFEQFATLISGIFRQIQKLEREEMEKHGLKGAFAQYLMIMSHYPEGITATQLCTASDRDKAAISRVVNEMESKGLVRREGEKDYRAVITLTDEGRKAVNYVGQRATVAVQKASEGLSDSHRKIFYAALSLIYSNLDKVCDEGIPENAE
ncbi:MAG: MarR family transcriptional regulator [Clostridia bacterium]|nr:MarR family transcriptional regulator [Clostridia bacterium]